VLRVAAPGIDGAERARRLERAAVLVVPGDALGDPGRVRLTVPPDPAAADRALRALANAAAPGGGSGGASGRAAGGSTRAP
jgi:aspartate/methionine/tyrosine aminotransferase